MSAAHEIVYRLLDESALLSAALKEGKAQKSSDFQDKNATSIVSKIASK